MTLNEYLKESKLNLKNYISLYNRDNVRFDGAFYGDIILDSYKGYEVLSDTKLKDIRLIQISYPDVMGVVSLEHKLNTNKVRQKISLPKKKK